MRSFVTKRGLTTVPAAIRRRHGIEPGTWLEWIDEGKTIRVIPIPPDPIAAAAAGSTKGLHRKHLEERASVLDAKQNRLDQR